MWTRKSLWAFFAEYLAVLILVFVALGFSINLGAGNPNPRFVISMCFGLSYGILVYFCGPISGGHINPAVTVAMIVMGQLSMVNALFYVLAQCLGAVTGAGILYFIIPAAQWGSLGVTMVNSDLYVIQGFEVEMIATFLLVFTKLASRYPKWAHLRGSASFANGIAVVIGHLFAIPYTGASMNPARSFGPAMVTLNFKDHWVYWVGPIMGGVLAAFLYQLLPNFETTKRRHEGDDVEAESLQSTLTMFPSCCNCQRLIQGFQRMWTLDFLWALFSEYLAVLILMVISLGSTINWVAGAGILLISVCFSLSYGILVHCFGHISGGHINPAITVAMVVMGQLSLGKALFYVLAQCLGAVTGAGILYFITPSAQRGSLGVTMVNLDLHVVHGFVVELIITFLLVLTIIVSCDPKRTHLRGTISIAYAIAVLIFHFYAVRHTGASMNPARSFGPAMVNLNFKDHWVYWVGPLLGSILAAFPYRLLSGPIRASPEDVPSEEIQTREAAWCVVLSSLGTGNEASYDSQTDTPSPPSTSPSLSSSPSSNLSSSPSPNLSSSPSPKLSSSPSPSLSSSPSPNLSSSPSPNLSSSPSPNLSSSPSPSPPPTTSPFDQDTVFIRIEL